MLTRRQLIHNIIPVAGATAGVCLLPDRGKSGLEKHAPDKLEPGQVWRSPNDGMMNVVMFPDPQDSHYWLVTQIEANYRNSWRAWALDSYVLETWTYLGAITDLVGMRRGR